MTLQTFAHQWWHYCSHREHISDKHTGNPLSLVVQLGRTHTGKHKSTHTGKHTSTHKHTQANKHKDKHTSTNTGTQTHRQPAQLFEENTQCKEPSEHKDLNQSSHREIPNARVFFGLFLVGISNIHDMRTQYTYAYTHVYTPVWDSCWDKHDVQALSKETSHQACTCLIY